MRTNYKVSNLDSAYFITSTIVKWVPVFREKENIDILIDSLTFSQKNKCLKIYSYVIMPEHFHLVCQSDKLVDIIRSIMSYTAKRIIDYYKKQNNLDILNIFKSEKKKHKTLTEYQVWQEGYKPKEIFDDNVFLQKCEYINFNPVKRGLVENITDYEYSSAKDYYLCKPGRIVIDDLQYD